jgi:EmrB/QacA subfamily drug resistance transporter
MADIAASESAEGLKSHRERRWLGLFILLAAVFVATLDNFIVFVAIPSIRIDLGATFGDVEFIVAGYTLTFAIGMITSGRLGDRFGRRRLFWIGFATFTVASGLCGAAQSPSALIAFRIVQGIASAILSPQVLAIIRVTFTEARERSTAFAWMGVTIGLAGVLGQVIGGLVVAANLWDLSWRPVFLINLPIGLLALALTPIALRESYAAGVQRLDLVGAALSSLGLGLLLYPLIEGREAGWPGWSIAMLGASLVVLGLFGLHQHRKTKAEASPLLDTRLFHDRAFVVGLLLILIFYATIPPYILSYSYMVQDGFGRSPVASALYFAPLAITFSITSFYAGRWALHGPWKVLMVGALVTTVGTAFSGLTASVLPGFTPAFLVPSMVVLGFGQGLIMTPMINAVLSGIPAHHTGVASGVLTTMQRLGSALGVAILEIPFITTLKRATAAGTPHVSAYVAAFSSVAFWISIVMVAVVLLLLALPSGRRSLIKPSALT